MYKRYQSLLILPIAFITACDSNDGGKSRGAIVLGDSSTIVTEPNEAVLQDMVPDLQPVIAQDKPADIGTTVTRVQADTPTQQAPPPEKPAPAVAGNGLTVPFKETTIFIPGITTRSYGRPDLQKARGASYELTSGTLAGKQLRITSGAVTKVSQRYETVIVLQDDGDKLPLESLGKYTSAWQQVTGNGSVYTISGLEQNKLGFKEANGNAIRNAVQQAARRKRLSKADTQEWLEAVRRVRAANQAPATVVLRSVMWRIEGKGFSKELRIDVPLP